MSDKVPRIGKILIAFIRAPVLSPASQLLLNIGTRAADERPDNVTIDRPDPGQSLQRSSSAKIHQYGFRAVLAVMCNRNFPAKRLCSALRFLFFPLPAGSAEQLITELPASFLYTDPPLFCFLCGVNPINSQRNLKPAAELFCKPLISSRRLPQSMVHMNCIDPYRQLFCKLLQKKQKAN